MFTLSKDVKNMIALQLAPYFPDQGDVIILVQSWSEQNPGTKYLAFGLTHLDKLANKSIVTVEGYKFSVDIDGGGDVNGKELVIDPRAGLTFSSC